MAQKRYHWYIYCPYGWQVIGGNGGRQPSELKGVRSRKEMINAVNADQDHCDLASYKVVRQIARGEPDYQDESSICYRYRDR